MVEYRKPPQLSSDVIDRRPTGDSTTSVRKGRTTVQKKRRPLAVKPNRKGR